MVWLSTETYGEVEQELARLRAAEEQRQNALASQPRFTPYSLPGEPGAMARREYLYDSPSGGVSSAPGGGYYVGNDYYAQLPDPWAGTELGAGGGSYGGATGGYPGLTMPAGYAYPAASWPRYLSSSPSGGVSRAPGGGQYVGNGSYAGQAPDPRARLGLQRPIAYGPMALPYTNPANWAPLILYDWPPGGRSGAGWRAVRRERGPRGPGAGPLGGAGIPAAGRVRAGGAGIRPRPAAAGDARLRGLRPATDADRAGAAGARPSLAEGVVRPDVVRPQHRRR